MKTLRLCITALIVAAASMAVASPALANPTQKTVVTYDCGTVGTFQVEGLPNNATAVQIVNSDTYHTFVGHQWTILDPDGNVISFFSDGAQGRVSPLYSCTGSSDGYTIVVLAQLT